MDIGAPFITHPQPPVLVEPGEGALHHPAVTAQPLAGVDPFPGDADFDVALAEGTAAAGNVVGLVGVAFVWPFAAAAVGLPDRGDSIEHLREDDRLVAVGSGQEFGQWQPAAFDGDMTFDARFGAIRGVGTGQFAPLFAGTLAASTLTRLQSMRPASPSRSSSARCNASHTPAACQSRSRRQQVTPEPQPISWGSSSQGMPDCSTKMMPVRAARSETRGRPPLGLGGSGGSSGATTAQRSSLTRGLVMLKVYHAVSRF